MHASEPKHVYFPRARCNGPIERTQWSRWNPVKNLGTFMWSGMLYFTPKAILIQYYNFAVKASEMRNSVSEYFDRYE